MERGANIGTKILWGQRPIDIAVALRDVLMLNLETQWLLSKPEKDFPIPLQSPYIKCSITVWSKWVKLYKVGYRAI